MTNSDNSDPKRVTSNPLLPSFQFSNFGEQIKSSVAADNSSEPIREDPESATTTYSNISNEKSTLSSYHKRRQKRSKYFKKDNNSASTAKTADRDEALLAVVMSSSDDNIVFEDEHPRSPSIVPRFLAGNRQAKAKDADEKKDADRGQAKMSPTKFRPSLERKESSSSALDGIVEAAAFPFFQTITSHSVKLDPEKLPTTFEISSHDLEGSDAGLSVGASSASSTSTSSSIYVLKDMSTGKTYDIRDLEKRGSTEQCFNVGYSLFPTKDEFIEELSERNVDSVVNGDKKECFSPIKEVAKSGKAISTRLKRTFSSKPSGVEEGDREDQAQEDETSSARPEHKGEESTSASRKEEDDDTSIINPPHIILKSWFGRHQSDTSAEKREDDSESSATGTKNDSTESKKGKADDRQRKKPPKEKKVKAAPIIQPKNTLPVKCVNKPKSSSDFNPMLLTSTITKAHDGPIWCSSTTQDGKYLATGGADGIIKIWEMSLTKGSPDSGPDLLSALEGLWKGILGEDHEEPLAPPLSTVQSECDALGTEILFLNSKPLQRFTDHDKDVVDLSWSCTNFLVSASLDKTARLWHPTRPVCLRIFRHVDAITSVSFHPTEDKYFLSGGFDKKLRIWNIPNGRVAEWAQAPNLITAATYDPDGKFIAAGLFDGKVIFYSLDGVKMNYFTQISCKNGGRKKGKKVTGLTFLPQLSDDKVTGDNGSRSPKRGIKAAKAAVRSFTSPKKKQVKQQLLITTNDSRLRLVGMNDFCMVRKFKGHLNSRFQIKARFSESGEFIISGSEARTCTVWNTATKRNPLNLNVTGLHMYDKMKAYESFEATKADPPVITDALFVPGSTVQNAFLSSGLFPTLNTLSQVDHDFSSAVIITSDYEGTMRVFLRRSCFDAVCHVAGPMGN